jgi:hypothetical protein
MGGVWGAGVLFVVHGPVEKVHELVVRLVGLIARKAGAYFFAGVVRGECNG